MLARLLQLLLKLTVDGLLQEQNPWLPVDPEGSVEPALLRLLMPSGVGQDDDGLAYVAYSSEDNLVMHISQLAPDFLSPQPIYVRRLINRRREAPSIFKHSGWYFMLTSGCTGWEPNRAEVFATRYALARVTSCTSRQLIVLPCITKLEKERQQGR